jgi:hypothetical protein
VSRDILYKWFELLLYGQTAYVYIAGEDGFYSFLRSRPVKDLGVAVHMDSLHVWCSSPIVVLREILPQW